MIKPLNSTKKLGFDKILYENWLVAIPTVEFRKYKSKPMGFFPWKTVKDLELVGGRFQSSYDAWFSSFKDLFAGIHELTEVGKVGKSYYVLKTLPGRFGMASLFLWTRSEDIFPTIGRARELGFKDVLTVLDEETAETIGTEKKGRVQIIAKSIRE